LGALATAADGVDPEVAVASRPVGDHEAGRLGMFVDFGG
jgi:hypothetical protein